MLGGFRARRTCAAFAVCSLLVAVLLLWPGPEERALHPSRRRGPKTSPYRQPDRAVPGRDPSVHAVTTGQLQQTPTRSLNDTVRVAWINRRMWHGTYRADPILNFVEHIVGLPATLKQADGLLHPHDAVDVFLVSQAGSVADLRAARAAHGAHAIFVYVNSEPQHDGYSFEDLVDVSFGQGPPGPAPQSSNPRCAAALASPNFLRTPFWLLNVFSRAEEAPISVPFSCRIMDVVNQTKADPERWAARPHLALHVARHAAFPRPELRELFDGVGKRVQAEAKRSRAAAAALKKDGKAVWHVVVPGSGKPHYNTPWPKGFSDDTWGKIRLAREARYSIQPENSRTPCGGFITDKLVHGHMAGAIPVHWGDDIEPEFWNPARVLVLDADGGNAKALAKRVYALETDPAARAEFFAEPVLAPGAGAWAAAWCADAERLLRRAIVGHVRLRERWPWVADRM